MFNSITTQYILDLIKPEELCDLTSVKVLVMMIGSPASGKSFLSRQLSEKYNLYWINQDTLKTKPRCLKAIQEAVYNKNGAVLDRQNSKSAERAEFLNQFILQTGQMLPHIADDTIADDTIADDTIADDTIADGTVVDGTVVDGTVAESTETDSVNGLLRPRITGVLSIIVWFDVPKDYVLHNLTFRQIDKYSKEKRPTEVPVIAIHGYYKNVEPPHTDSDQSLLIRGKDYPKENGSDTQFDAIYRIKLNMIKPGPFSNDDSKRLYGSFLN
ncbi:AAA domain protein [Gregarina niphandrodes]|uniref:AAA domain protein n=1 Tax=Gregarina niphandrodes TaxID=110365 RepID=A0A023B219_GRENI|nr:AAA domain protein [Gregarina niphandrodes]EZG50028.1 AAA domain protein [Gregarina niphandrodes]|eukprot:XP_011132032.1 AAA domain protein [Gregarina niphandrodes]